ncbi:MAG TPA: hypothetical protein VF713_06490 [Thermoanaerobaculia bacterium]
MAMRQYQIDNLIAIAASFAIILTVTVLVLRAWRRAFEANHELRRQLLEKMTSEEVARMVATEEGRRAITALVGGEETRGIAGSMSRGPTLILIGLALGLSAAMSHLPLVGTAGLIAIAAGFGQFIAAWLITRERRT